MEEQNQNLSPEKSLSIINEMIGMARKEACATGYYIILWGILISFAQIATYVLVKMDIVFDYGYLWYSVIGLGALGSAYYGYRYDSKRGNGSFLNRIYGFVWFGFLLTYAIILIFSNKLGSGGHLIYAIAGNAVFLTGIITRFKPLIIGGIILWITCIIQLSFSPYLENLLVGAAGMILGYVVPGVLLERRQRRTS